MTNQQLADQRRLEEILKLARMQLNEEYMKKHSAAQTTWLTGARTAWTTSGTLLPFATKFVYPSEEEVVARGVEIYNTLTATVAPAPAPAPAVEAVKVQAPVVEVAKVEEPVTELLQAGGDFVIAEIFEEPAIDEVIVPLLSEETPIEETVCAVNELTEVTEVTQEPAVAPSVTDSLLESKFKSLFTKWGGRGNY
jgi:hypothetical protein